jgi:TRAP-type C4-dicarboxylate transport system substrate-binding protein
MINREALIAAARKKREEHKGKDAKVAELQKQLADATETMRTIANLFSKSVWALLPEKIKSYFEKYREG